MEQSSDSKRNLRIVQLYFRVYIKSVSPNVTTSQVGSSDIQVCKLDFLVLAALPYLGPFSRHLRNVTQYQIYGEKKSRIQLAPSSKVSYYSVWLGSKLGIGDLSSKLLDGQRIRQRSV